MTSSRFASSAAGLLRPVAFPDRRGEQGREHADERVAAAEFVFGTGQCRPQQLLGQANLAFPEVGQRNHELAPARYVAKRAAEVAARRSLLVVPRLGWVSLEQRPEGAPVRMHIEQQRIGQRRRLRPRIVQFRELVGIVSETGRPAQDQGALAFDRRIAVGLRQDALHHRFGFLVPAADRECPRRGQHQARTSVELRRWHAAEPIEHCRRPGRAA